MHKRLIMVLAVFTTLSVLGCATPAGIAYHNANKDRESFWMTITKVSPDRSYQASALWYCKGGDKPTCVQADMIKCENGHNCQINASEIFQSVLGI